MSSGGIASEEGFDKKLDTTIVDSFHMKIIISLFPPKKKVRTISYSAVILKFMDCFEEFMKRTRFQRANLR